MIYSLDSSIDFDIKNIEYANFGRDRIKWAANDMPVLSLIRKRFQKEKPLKGIKIGICLHITAETANLIDTLKEGDAEVFLCASNPLSIQDDVASSLVRYSNISVYGIRNEDMKTYYKHIMNVINLNPSFIIDDGADLINVLISKKHNNLNIPNILGATEQTTTGINRLKSMFKENMLQFPIIAVNNALSKHLFDNQYGTAQSTINAIIYNTNKLIAGSKFIICGYGWCGRGMAKRVSGMGANVIVTEVNPIKALEAIMDGYNVMPISIAANLGDFFCTVTGNINVISTEHFLSMKDGAVICNAGHFNVEINLLGLQKQTKKVKKIKKYIEEYTLLNDKKIYLLGQGRLVNLIMAEGNSPSVMDMSFANQALAIEYLVKNFNILSNKIYNIANNIDNEIAKLKLKTLGIQIDSLTVEQNQYINSWEIGT